MRRWLVAVLLLACVVTLDARDAKAVRAFKKATGYPLGRPGYVVDHQRPLCLGGPDTPANMMWQTIADAKVKDVDEKRLCAAWRRFEKRWIIMKVVP